ncbi:MAG: ATP-binding protein [Acidimicrobiia bacterium]
MDRVVLDLPARLEYLALVRTVVTAVADCGSSLPGPRLEDLRLTVTEAVANAIDAERRRPGGAAHPIEIRCWAEPDQVRVEVHDVAGGFDPASVRAAPPPTAPGRLGYERGLGIPLMRELADALDIRREGDGTTVSLSVTAEDRR